MKRSDILDSIHYVDDALIAESEKYSHSRKMPALWKAAAAAAIVALMSVTAFAAVKLLSRPVESGAVVTEGTISPVTFVGGDIYPEPQVGLKVVMETEVDADAPTHLEEMYYLTMPEDWTGSMRSCMKSSYLYYEMEYVWKKAGKAGEVRFAQELVGGYISSDHVVDYLHELPLQTEVTTKILQLADMELLQIYIPPVGLDGYVDRNTVYYEDGEYRLYWTDGRYMFRLEYPSWLTAEEVETILRGVKCEVFVPDYPDGYGTVVLERIQAMAPSLKIEKGSTGTTFYNNITSMGNMLYRDGLFYFSEPERLFIYDPETEKLEAVALEGDLFPTYMFLTDDYLLFAASWQEDLHAMDLKTREIEVVYQGLGNGSLYADGMMLYATHGGALQRIDLETGKVDILAENIARFYMDENQIVAIPKAGNAFLRAERTDLLFEEHALSFCPADDVILDGEDIYFKIAAPRGEANRWRLVKWNDGMETALNLQCGSGQRVNGVLYYYDSAVNNLLRSYNMETGERKVLFEDCGNFTIHAQRYLVVQYTLNQGWSILDLETGEVVSIPYPAA